MWQAMLADPTLSPQVHDLSALQGIPGATMMVPKMINRYAGTVRTGPSPGAESGQPGASRTGSAGEACHRG